MTPGFRLFCALCSFALASCSGTQKQPTQKIVALGPPIVFAFGTTEGDEFGSAATRGRVTAVLFVTTFDLASQAEAKHLNEVLRSHTPRINAGAVVLEVPKHAVLADVFKKSLGLSYPVAIADNSTLEGTGPFGSIPGVPTLVILDRAGREVIRRTGLMNPRQIDEALSLAE